MYRFQYAPSTPPRTTRAFAPSKKRADMLPASAQGSSKNGWPAQCEKCEKPVVSVIDDSGLDDESASVVIVGGGPHALAALAALHEGFQQGDEGPSGSDGNFGTG